MQVFRRKFRLLPHRILIQDREKRKARLAKESAKALQQRLTRAEADIAATELAIAELEAQMGLPEI